MIDTRRQAFAKRFNRFVKDADAAGYVIAIYIDSPHSVRLLTKDECRQDDIRALGTSLSLTPGRAQPKGGRGRV